MSKNTNRPPRFRSPQLITFLDRLQQLEPEAWEHLLHLYAGILHSDISVSLKKRRLPTDAADDIAQETWLTAVQHISEFVGDDRRQLYHWLRAISLNHIRNFKAKQQPALSLEDIEAANPGNCDAVDQFLAKHSSRRERLVEDEVALREQLHLLDQALLSLKPNERDIVIRRYLWEQKPEQLALLYSQLKPRSISQLLFRFKFRVQNRVIGLQQN